jgi:hypothetical protein
MAGLFEASAPPGKGLTFIIQAKVEPHLSEQIRIGVIDRDYTL